MSLLPGSIPPQLSGSSPPSSASPREAELWSPRSTSRLAASTICSIRSSCFQKAALSITALHQMPSNISLLLVSPRLSLSIQLILCLILLMVSSNSILFCTETDKISIQASWFKTSSEISGIKPDSSNVIEQGNSTEQERQSVRETLLSAYDKNISTTLKTELCNLDSHSYNYAVDASRSKFPIPLILYVSCKSAA